MAKWVLGLCAAIYVTLLVFGDAPEGEELAVVAEPEAVSQDVAVVEEEAAPETPVIPAAVTPETQEPEIAEVAPLELPEIDVAALDVTPIDPAPLAQTEPEPEAEVIAVAATPQDTGTTAQIIQPSEPEVAPEAPSNGVGEIWTVTGNTVNLRAEAGTFGAVLGQTRRGDSAEVIEMLDNGWARVFILESGLEAYMSADFLRPDQG